MAASGIKVEVQQVIFPSWCRLVELIEVKQSLPTKHLQRKLRRLVIFLENISSTLSTFRTFCKKSFKARYGDSVLALLVSHSTSEIRGQMHFA